MIGSTADRRFSGSTLADVQHRDLTIADPGTVEGLTAELAAHGCLNPADRALELASSTRCKFYRGTDDTIVSVTLGSPS